MATGPEHYRQAERLLEATRVELVNAARRDQELGVGEQQTRDALTYTAPDLLRAQVHATLALAAATAAAAAGTGVALDGYGGAQEAPGYVPACTCGGGLGNGLHSTGCAVVRGVTT